MLHKFENITFNELPQAIKYSNKNRRFYIIKTLETHRKVTVNNQTKQLIIQQKDIE